jgi:hypothetical protein
VMGFIPAQLFPRGYKTVRGHEDETARRTPVKFADRLGAEQDSAPRPAQAAAHSICGTTARTHV